MVIKIQIITTENCAICNHVLNHLGGMRHEFPHLEIEEINAKENPAVLEEYPVRSFPGIVIDGKLESSGPITDDQLRQLLERHKG
jgi:predicted thioredoxin/glutaredoxin